MRAPYGEEDMQANKKIALVSSALLVFHIIAWYYFFQLTWENELESIAKGWYLSGESPYSLKASIFFTQSAVFLLLVLLSPWHELRIARVSQYLMMLGSLCLSCFSMYTTLFTVSALAASEYHYDLVTRLKWSLGLDVFAFCVVVIFVILGLKRWFSRA